MKVTGGSSYIKFDLENGYVLKASGERLVGNSFLVYKSSMKKWQAPHEDEELDEQQIESIILEVKSMINENTINIIFE